MTVKAMCSPWSDQFLLYCCQYLPSLRPSCSCIVIRTSGKRKCSEGSLWGTVSWFNTRYWMLHWGVVSWCYNSLWNALVTKFFIIIGENMVNVFNFPIQSQLECQLRWKQISGDTVLEVFGIRLLENTMHGAPWQHTPIDTTTAWPPSIVYINPVQWFSFGQTVGVMCQTVDAFPSKTAG